MNKFLTLILIVLLTFSITLLGCGSNDNNDDDAEHVHELIKVEAEESTYEKQGHIAYYKCKGSDCGLIFADSLGVNEIELNDTLVPLKLRPVDFLTDELEYEFEILPDCLYYANLNEIDLASMCVAGTTNARLNDRYATSFPGLNYIYLKNDGLGDFTVEFTVNESGVWHFAFEIFAIKDDVYERRVTNFRINNSKDIMLDYTHSDANAGKHQYASGVSAELEKGKYFLTLSLPSIFDDKDVKSLFIHKFYYCKVQ